MTVTASIVTVSKLACNITAPSCAVPPDAVSKGRRSRFKAGDVLLVLVLTAATGHPPIGVLVLPVTADAGTCVQDAASGSL